MMDKVAPATANDGDIPGVPLTELAARLRPLLVRAARQLRTQRADASVTLAELSALNWLSLHGAMSATNLADIEGVRPPSMTKVVTRLERLGLVRRTDDPTDGRKLLVSITPDGESLLDSENDSRTAWLVRQLSKLDQAERCIVLLTLPVLVKIIES